MEKENTRWAMKNKTSSTGEIISPSHLFKLNLKEIQFIQIFKNLQMKNTLNDLLIKKHKSAIWENCTFLISILQ